MSIDSWCCLPTSSSATLFSFCLQSFPASGSFLNSSLFTSGGQSIGASASAFSIMDGKAVSILLGCFLKRIYWCWSLAANTERNQERGDQKCNRGYGQSTSIVLPVLQISYLPSSYSKCPGTLSIIHLLDFNSNVTVSGILCLIFSLWFYIFNIYYLPSIFFFLIIYQHNHTCCCCCRMNAFSAQ